MATTAAIDCDRQRALIGHLGDVASLDQLRSHWRASVLGADVLRTTPACLSHAPWASRGLRGCASSANHISLKGHRTNFHYRQGDRRHLVKDGDGDGEGSAGIGDIHDAGQAALTGAARQQQVHLQARIALLG